MYTSRLFVFDFQGCTEGKTFLIVLALRGLWEEERLYGFYRDSTWREETFFTQLEEWMSLRTGDNAYSTWEEFLSGVRKAIVIVVDLFNCFRIPVSCASKRSLSYKDVHIYLASLVQERGQS